MRNVKQAAAILAVGGGATIIAGLIIRQFGKKEEIEKIEFDEEGNQIIEVHEYKMIKEKKKNKNISNEKNLVKAD